MLKQVIFLSFMAFSFETCACSFGGPDVFIPTLERWEPHPGPRQKDRNAEGDYWEKVPAPIINVTNITRGSKSPGSSCSDAGVINLEDAIGLAKLEGIAMWLQPKFGSFVEWY